MRRDLEGLQITKGELRYLSGTSVDDILRPAAIENSQQRSKFLYKETASVFGLTGIFFTGSLTFLNLMAWELRGITIDFIFPNSPPAIVFAGVGLGSLGAAIAARFLWLTGKTALANSLSKLLNDVDKYNGLIQAIDLNDQLEDAGNPEMRIANREQIVAALKLTRQDLVRALKTERILRENHRFIERNPELFASNLTAIEALQVSDRATERGRILNEALQIALNAQGEMRKLNKF
ncbi:MAG: hypothetical protein F6J93_24125 [Oscillatoria sp. SIO1A7]|nr:hypothetical protein [Oscillatoria sp. SIO1A7]